MKILIASDLHWPTINGVATFSRNLAKGMADLGHEVLVIAPSQTGKPYREVDSNHVIIRTRSVPFPFYQNFRISPTPQREVKRIIEEFDPDVIHIQMLMWIGQSAMRYGNKAGVPIVSTNHAIPENLMDNLKLLAPIARPINYMLREYGRRFHSRSDFITMPTQSAIDMLNASDKILDKPMVPISNGIDLSRFKPGPVDDDVYARFKLPKDMPIVTYIGRIDAEKHINKLIEAFIRVLDEKEAHLLIVGDGVERPNLEHMVHQKNIVRHVTFTGKVSDEDLEALHRVGTVYCMPSPAELQSIATLEAMASGQPIVAVDAGALGELCQDGRNGVLCERDNVEQMHEGIVRIISDKKLRQAFAEESLAIAKTHDIAYTMRAFEKVYSDLTKSSTKSATAVGVS